MSDKRIPDFVLLLKKRGNRSNKIEMFNWVQFDPSVRYSVDRYRLRINGKWWPKDTKKYFTLTEVKELTFKAIRPKLRSQ